MSSDRNQPSSLSPTLLPPSVTSSSRNQDTQTEFRESSLRMVHINDRNYPVFRDTSNTYPKSNEHGPRS